MKCLQWHFCETCFDFQNEFRICQKEVEMRVLIRFDPHLSPSPHGSTGQETPLRLDANPARPCEGTHTWGACMLAGEVPQDVSSAGASNPSRTHRKSAFPALEIAAVRCSWEVGNDPAEMLLNWCLRVQWCPWSSFQSWPIAMKFEIILSTSPAVNMPQHVRLMSFIQVLWVLRLKV